LVLFIARTCDRKDANFSQLILKITIIFDRSYNDKER